MQLKCAALVALLAFYAAVLSACGQGTVSAADNPTATHPAPGWSSSDSTAERFQPLSAESEIPGEESSDLSGENREAAGTPIPTPLATVTPRPTATAVQECNWMWAYQELSDVTIQVSSALDAAGIAYSNVSAQTLGENCLTLDGQPQYFAPMETDYEITIPVRSLSDRETLGNQAAAVLFLLNTNFPPDSTPGPIAGKVKLTFTARGATLRLVIEQELAEEVLESNLRGSALLAALDQ